MLYCMFRDLKPENVLLKNKVTTSSRQPILKLTDFGLAKLGGTSTMMKTVCGTPLYCSPEVLMHATTGKGYNEVVRSMMHDAIPCSSLVCGAHSFNTIL